MIDPQTAWTYTKRMYRTTTRAIQVTVEPSFVESESEPDEDRYFWAYKIEIANPATR